MIPKVIHYCWFGKGEMPEKAKECIESWRKFCPEYEIIEWNEENYDLNSCLYIQEAYVEKKWAFVSDFARFEILYKYGGVYFDTDVELLKPIDEIIKRGPYMGMQQGKKTIYGVEYEVNPGLGLAAEPGLPIYKEILDYYRTLHFCTNEGGQNFVTIVDYTTGILRQHGLKNADEIQTIANITIYPSDYFCPINFNTGEKRITDNTVSIHHFVASWFSPLDWSILKVERKFGNHGKFKYIVGQVIMLPLRVIRKIKNVGFLQAVKIGFKKVFRKKKNVGKNIGR